MNLLPRQLGPVPHLYLAQLCQEFVEEIVLAVKGGNEGTEELALTIGKADKRFKKSVLSSIAQFGLADHDEKEAEIVTKSANEFFMQGNSTDSFPN